MPRGKVRWWGWAFVEENFSCRAEFLLLPKSGTFHCSKALNFGTFLRIRLFRLKLFQNRSFLFSHSRNLLLQYPALSSEALSCESDHFGSSYLRMALSYFHTRLRFPCKYLQLARSRSHFSTTSSISALINSSQPHTSNLPPSPFLLPTSPPVEK